jgi:two-component system OmpR family response regulator
MDAVQHHILVVDDHKDIRDLLGQFLRKHDLKVTTARDGIEMRACLAREHVDLVVLDLMLPGEGGLKLCGELRTHSTIPVIMLTALGEEADRVVGLEIGADDYVTKPFSPRELLARIKAVLRRGRSPAETEASTEGAFRFSGWTLDPIGRVLRSPDGVLVDLTTSEYDLLCIFVEHPQRVLSREDLLEATRNRATSSAAFDRAVDVQISRLRRKLDHASSEGMIKTVRNAGYILAVTVERS